jgi:beta-hydroxylase
MPGLMTLVIKFVEKTNILFAKNGNLPIYDKKTFPWVAEVEKEWRKIRAELDKIMERKEDLPSFHEIMPEVKTITTDNLWKTFFLVGYGLESDENSTDVPNDLHLKIPGMKTA